MDRRHKSDQHSEQAVPESFAALAWMRGLCGSFGGYCQALGDWYKRRVPDYIPIAIKLALIFALLITIGMVGLGLVIGTKQSGQLSEQIDKFGTTLVQRMAESAREPLLANDHLSMETIVNTLTEDANIDGAGIFSDEMKVVAQAGLIPDSFDSLDRSPNSKSKPLQIFWQSGNNETIFRAYVSFVTPINFHDITVGYVLLSFDHSE